MKLSSILCFGDSWSTGNYHGLQDQLCKHGHTDIKITSYNHWGSTAEHFAKNPQILPSQVSKSSADCILLSLGGNDYKNFYLGGEYLAPWTVTNRIHNSLQKVLTALYEKHPKVKVVMYGYDFTGDVEPWLFS